MVDLFVKCHILDEHEEGETLTKLIVQQAMQCPPLVVGSRVMSLWPADGSSKLGHDE